MLTVIKFISWEEYCSPDGSGETDPPPTVPPTGGGTTGISVSLEVQNNLVDSCKIKALERISDTSINNLITNLYNKFYVGGTAQHNILFKEAGNLTVGGSNPPAYSSFESINNTWEVTLSNNYFSGSGYSVSREAWGQIIIHEIIHGFIHDNWSDVVDGQDHLFIFKNFVEPSRDLLVNAFGMSPSDALGLALNGMKDLWGYSDFEQLCINTYGKNYASIDATFNKFTKGEGGTKCN